MKRDLASLFSGAVMPGDDASAFVQQQLHSGEPQLPQYDPQGGWNAAKGFGYMGAGMAPGGGVADAAGQLGGPSIRENWSAGNYGSAALQALGVGADAAYLGGPLLGGVAKLAMAAAPAAKVAGKVAKARGLGDMMADAAKTANAAPTGFTAYHGSPHSFDKFDLSKIGTGEGAQAYGHGLYFADNEAVARSYRDNLTGPKYAVGGVEQPSALAASEAIWNLPDLPETARYEAGWHINRNYPLTDALSHLEKNSPEDFAALKAAMDAGKIAEVPNPGSMYEVRIKADPEQFLDWDRPPSQQPQNVVDAFGKIGVPLPPDEDAFWMNTVANSLAEKDGSWSTAAGARNVTQKLAEHGVPGVRYLDEGSRGPSTTFDVGSPRDGFGPYSNYRSEAEAQQQLELLRKHGFDDAEIKTVQEPQSRNYVVFDDKMVEIMRKYGIVPPAALGYEVLQPQTEEPSSGNTPAT